MTPFEIKISLSNSFIISILYLNVNNGDKYKSKFTNTVYYQNINHKQRV